MKAGQGCWTCKKRKIGCDKGLPFCNNCQRTGRECMGYGVRLVWPDNPDGRRKAPKHPVHTGYELEAASGAHYGKQFLNISYNDIKLSRQDPRSLTLYNHVNRGDPQPSLNPIPNLSGHDSDLLIYYERKIARMISTVDAKNGFRLELIPMALSNSSSAARGLYNAILALSAFHRYGSGAAIEYKTKALQSLSLSLSEESTLSVPVESQLAASMMLCVYNVFDESEGNWHTHLNGARTLLHRSANLKGGRLDYGFLNTWFLYHEILGAFSQPQKHRYDGTSSLDLIQRSDFDNTVIIGSLGCSVEVMEIIHHINQLRAAANRKIDDENMREDGPSPLPPVMWSAKALGARLVKLIQQLHPDDFAQHSVKERAQIMTTAELYRLAAILYLQRICPRIETSENTDVYLEQAFKVFESLEICTSPWPLFVVACEAQSDEQRIMILAKLDRMDEARKIGNVLVLRHLIENYWKQQDLLADSDRPKSLKWWELMNFDTAAPWFI